MVYAAAPGSSTLPYAESSDKHFHPKGKPPSAHTLKVIRAARERMPFSDRRDFEEAEKGFIAPLKSMVIQADGSHLMGKCRVQEGEHATPSTEDNRLWQGTGCAWRLVDDPAGRAERAVELQ